MSNKPTQRDKQIITVAVAFTFGLGAFMFPTDDELFSSISICVKLASCSSQCEFASTISTNKSMRGPRYAMFNLQTTQANIYLHQGWFNHVELGQSLAQVNDCSGGSSCINSGSNNANIHVGNHHSSSNSNYAKIDQSTVQENHCSGGSTCINSGSNTANININ